MELLVDKLKLALFNAYQTTLALNLSSFYRKSKKFFSLKLGIDDTVLMAWHAFVKENVAHTFNFDLCL